MSNLTSVGITSGVPSSGTGTVSTIDQLLAAGAPISNGSSALQVGIVGASSSPQAAQPALVVVDSPNSSARTVTLSSNPTIVSVSSGAFSIINGANTVGVVTAQVSSASPALAVAVSSFSNFSVTSTPPTTVMATVASVSGTNSTNLKAASATLYSAHFYNNSSLPRFVKLTNLASAPTVGTASVSLTIGVAPGNFRDLNFTGALSSVGLGYFITGAIASTDTTSISSNDIMGAIEYA